MTNKLLLIGIAITAVGLVALPQTLALFAGQHNWYNVDKMNTTNLGVPCVKCHADVNQELTTSQNNGVHSTVTCVSCHVTALANTNNRAVAGKVGGGDAADENIHAAGLPFCLDCHGGNPPAGIQKNGGGYAPKAITILNGTYEVHTPFVAQAATDSPQNKTSLLKGANEACVACHTHVAVDINWQKAYKISFDARETSVDNVTGKYTWNVGNFISEGTVNTTTYGNRTGAINTATPNNVTMPEPTPVGYNPLNP